MIGLRWVTFGLVGIFTCYTPLSEYVRQVVKIVETVLLFTTSSKTDLVN